MQGGELDVERMRAAAAPAVFRSGRHAAARRSCSSSRPTASGSGSSSTSTASCRASSRSRTSSRRSSASSRRRRRAAPESFRREPDGSVVVDGMAPLRTLNRRLGTQFPLDGPKTLNGLIVEHLGEIPDAGHQLQGRRPGASRSCRRRTARCGSCACCPRWAATPRLYKRRPSGHHPDGTFYANGISGPPARHAARRAENPDGRHFATGLGDAIRHNVCFP